MHTFETTSPPHKARIVDAPSSAVIWRWLSAARADFRRDPATSIAYGVGFALIGWAILWALWYFDQGWALLPIIAGGMLVGPLAAVGLYRLSRRDEGGVASLGQVVLLGVILMIFALTWIRAATLIFAIFFGLLPFSGFMETMTTMLSTPQGLATLIVGGVFGGLFAALGFAVSVFSLPMLVDREIDCFSAMALSFNATTHNLKLMLCWAVIVCIAVAVGVLSGLIGMIVIFPLLGYATWHAYCDLFKGDDA